jgi:hypothetical protein
MGIMDRLFGGGKIKTPPRHRSGGFGNLALGILPTQDGIGAATWDTAPTNLIALTDEVRDTHLTQDGIDGDNTQVYIEIDLGRLCEVYEITISNIHVAGQGFMKAAGAAQNINLVSGIDGETAATGTTRDVQVLAGDGDWYNSTLHFAGNGIPVRYVWATTTGDGVNNFNVDISEIEVLGC